MNVWMLAAGLLMIAGLAPALYFVLRGSAAQRLVGLQLGCVVGVLVLIAITEAAGTPFSVIVPLVLAALAATGTLVFTRLLRPHSTDDAASDGPNSTDTNSDGHSAAGSNDA